MDAIQIHWRNPEFGWIESIGESYLYLLNRSPEGVLQAENAANARRIAAIGLAFTGIPADTTAMLNKFHIVLLLTMATCSLPGFSQNAPEYTDDAQLKLPANYRGWVYLTTGFDMSYNPSMQMADHHMFDNVFVSPESYKAFVDTGTWPDKTMLVLEVRGAEGKGSINQKGNFQGTDVMGLEVHVKDTARFPGGWAFFGFDDSKTAKMVPVKAECYSCHAAHAAVDTTFVQFYPTLLPIAKAKGTLSAGYQKDAAAEVKK